MEIILGFMVLFWLVVLALAIKFFGWWIILIPILLGLKEVFSTGLPWGRM